MTTGPALVVAPEVADAIGAGRPVVALESTIISHGMPYPTNVQMAREVEGIVRGNGAVPATIAVLDGRCHVGLGDDHLEQAGYKRQCAAHFQDAHTAQKSN
jgi:pseudouridine-5'-phosphate glycosidase